ncbi:helix-turn-helix transcriptional regulator [Halomonas sp. HMF6819]|uniref:helix-turn-helix transcriptional regulator n=1 Tax=Halomonas sp. HMF6819 TaxID=3373085 RepID=UPI003796908B
MITTDTLKKPCDDGAISATELQRLSARLVEKQRFEAPEWDKRYPPLNGRMWVSDIAPGMQLRLADIEDRFGLKSQAELPEGIKIALVMKGCARIGYGNTTARLGPSEPHRALLALLPNKTPFTRTGQPGTRERTLTLSLSPGWLKRQGFEALARGIRHTVQLHYWRPSTGLLSLAEALFERGDQQPPLRLALEGFAMLLAGEALAVAPRAPLAPSVSPRLAKLMALIDRGEARGITQRMLAKRLGVSLSALQRSFQRTYGEALGPYLRRYHLELARKALTRESISIERAASLAGYASATNFATAFKREFGIAPRDFRREAST